MTVRKIIVQAWTSLDGVLQGHASQEEDPSGGFRHGGWSRRYFDDRSKRWLIENLTQAGGFIFGRGTYERFAAHWPSASAQEQVLAQPLND